MTESLAGADLIVSIPETVASAIEAAFDSAFAARAPGLTLRREVPEDRAALRDLFAACSPLGGLIAGPLLDLQFTSQDDTFRATRPQAMRRIVCLDHQLIGRIIVDWQTPGASHGVDIAVHPDHRGSGAGLAMLRTWLAVADADDRLCSLDVIADNPARGIYRRLGFVEQPCDPTAPYRQMTRPRPRAKPMPLP